MLVEWLHETSEARSAGPSAQRGRHLSESERFRQAGFKVRHVNG